MPQLPDCLEVQPIEALAELPVEGIPNYSQSNVAGWALLAVVLALLIIEGWLIATGRPTISQWVRRKTQNRRWWKGFGIVSIAFILWHLFEGGPI